MKTPTANWNFISSRSFRFRPEGLAALVACLLLGAPAWAEIAIERQAELLYFLKHDCGSCHGLTRSGGLGSPLLPEVLADRSDEDLTEIIMEGLPGTPMPPWKELLTEDEARWLVRAIKENKWQK
ncbi:MAG: cytochrome c [Rhodospirillaceae bacterium]|nr:cytochrome c [Rhodospirillaceae bacterium]